MGMPTPFVNVAVARAAERLPGLRRVPLARLVIVTELAILAKAHFERLTPQERRRLFLLLRDAGGRPSNLSDRQRREFEKLVEKLDPKLFATNAFEKFSPVPPGRRGGGGG
jgi:hypothetical protein